MSSSSTDSNKIRTMLFRRNGCNASDLTDNDVKEEIDHLQRLYLLALDELNFAQDSMGSLYYEGDRITAHEAINDCTNTFMRLLSRISDIDQRRHLRLTIIPKLVDLQEQYNQLPPPPPSSP
ncbi:hypothetical protein O0I10_012226 [Lichtheimia ornata]|uniref:Uncharacterized protein n=1 Tax=Lichtheimia ornata TaxID=688661 RepID=A0AAD7US50_9FUNG|nr:uncharacterized protein O0I10_012226 [Lichtheimia ornata]KAJ8652168.1 hypothetical protein O0I10_012226 [Lichtheimia ornata]